jgi:hypothetical protein
VVADEWTVAEKKEADFFVRGAERLSKTVLPAQEGVQRTAAKRDSRSRWHDGERIEGE